MNLNKNFNSVGVTLLLLFFIVGLVAAKLADMPLIAVFAVVVVDQWEKVAVLRFGRYRGLRGPGLFFIVPIVDTLSRYVDQRVRVTTVSAESTLTRDTVPVNVDAIIFWLVWNAEKSILEVEDFKEAITLSSQTALRESIGRHQLAQMITDRETLGRELQRILDEKTTPWGITVQSVEIRDVRIPQALENAMSQQAQAERERQARVILGEAEVQVRSIRAGLPRLRGESRRLAFARHEHALRSHPREGRHGNRAIFCNRNNGPWRRASHYRHRQTTVKPQP
jgi:regulator of protease activity HflC (stomatin/prohibitin superfamily)